MNCLENKTGFKIAVSNIVCVRDLDKPNLEWQSDFRLEPIFATAPAASKNTAHLKRGQNLHKNNDPTASTKFQSQSLYKPILK